MNLKNVLFTKSFLKCAMLLPALAFILAGCATNDKGDINAPPEHGNAPTPNVSPGDTLTISFDGPPDAWPTVEKTVNGDGTITLSDIGAIKVAGKTTGEIEQLIHDKYVPTVVRRLTVTVKAGDRVYYVGGEVKSPGRSIYVGQITFSKAITSAGGFTEFSDKKKILLERIDGRRYYLNCDRILDGKDPDPAVFPGDQITVYRKIF
jgi:protein involved in polysaccharide export with SLBB domain